MIGHIYIKNFRSIKESEIKLDRINVLIGSNGSGKSNFLNFFKMVRAIVDQDMINYFKRRDGFLNVKYKGSPRNENIEGVIDIDNANAYFFELSYAENNNALLEKDGDYWNYNDAREFPESISEIKERWDKKNYPHSVNSGSILKEGGNERYDHVYKRLNQINIFHFHDTSPLSPLRQQSKINDNKTFRENGENLAAYLYKIKVKEPFNYKLIENTINSVFPNFEGFNLEPLELNNDSMELVWNDSRFPEEYMNASHFSDGTLRFIALAVLLLQKELPSIIIIDEPELGLHPFAIHKLAAMLKNAAEKGAQIILATQSVELLNYFETNEIITVDYDKKQTVFNRLDPKKLHGWLDEYSLGDLWQKNIIGGQV